MIERHSPPALPRDRHRARWPRLALPWLSLITALALLAQAPSASARHRKARHGKPGGHAAADRAPVAPAAEPLAVRIITEDPLVSNGEALTLALSLDGITGADEPKLGMEVNGRPAPFAVVSAPKPAAPGQPRRGEWSLRVAAPPVDCVVTATVSDRGRTAFSSPLRVLRFQAPVTSPRLFALVIGVSSYADKRLDLRFAAKDAQDFVTALRAGAANTIYSKAEYRVLTNADATRAGVLAGIDWLHGRVTKEDVAVVFLAGHGMQEPGSGRYHFLPHDADVRALPTTALGQEQFTALRTRVAGRLLLFLDSCHAGDVMRKAADEPLPRDFLTELSGQGAGVVVFASAAGPQAARESLAWGNGAFTRALVEGLHGRADFNRSGTVSVSELELYVSERVRTMTLGAQSPVSAKPYMISDFAIAAVALAPPAERAAASPTGYAPLIFAAVICALVAMLRRRPEAVSQLSLPMMVSLRNSLETLRSHLPGCNCHQLRGSREARGATAIDRRPVDPKSLLLRSLDQAQAVHVSQSGRHGEQTALHVSVRVTPNQPPLLLRSMGHRLRRAAEQSPLLRSFDPTLRSNSEFLRSR